MTLREYLDENKLTLAAFAALVGIRSKSHIRALTIGTRKPSWGLLCRIERQTGGAVKAADFQVKEAA